MTGVFEDHLNLDAVVSFADGELSDAAYQRAAAHVHGCGRCAAEVAEQETAQRLLRSAQLPRMPGELFDSLTSIPVALPCRPMPASGVEIQERGGVSRIAGGMFAAPTQAARSRRFRLGAGALAAALAVGAVVSGSASDQGTPIRPAAPQAGSSAGAGAGVGVAAVPSRPGPVAVRDHQVGVRAAR